MTITIPAHLAASVAEAARQKDLPPEVLVLRLLWEHYPPPLPEPRDDWERALLSIGRPSGANLSDEDLSREAMYD